MGPELFAAIIIGIVQAFMAAILFLVGRLLNANHGAITELRTALRELGKVIESLREKVTSVELSVERLKVKDEVKDAAE